MAANHPVKVNGNCALPGRSYIVHKYYSLGEEGDYPVINCAGLLVMDINK
ncbi:MAG: hypothetical protein ACM3H8_10150 [Sphingobacteriales bacterium]